MKSLRQPCLALMFTLAVAINTFAGEMHTTVAPPPAPTATTEGQMGTTVAGQIETPSGEATVAGSATEVALSLLQSVLALF